MAYPRHHGGAGRAEGAAAGRRASRRLQQVERRAWRVWSRASVSGVEGQWVSSGLGPAGPGPGQGGCAACSRSMTMNCTASPRRGQAYRMAAACRGWDWGLGLGQACRMAAACAPHSHRGVGVGVGVRPARRTASPRGSMRARAGGTGSAARGAAAATRRLTRVRRASQVARSAASPAEALTAGAGFRRRREGSLRHTAGGEQAACSSCAAYHEHRKSDRPPGPYWPTLASGCAQLSHGFSVEMCSASA